MSPECSVANQILREEGHLICAFLAGPAPLPKIGDIIPHDIQGVPGPFAIVGTATKQDYIDQSVKYSSVFQVAVARARADAAIAFFKLAAE